jgi:glycosyltransferase involved in cell wall biosynthesis
MEVSVRLCVIGKVPPIQGGVSRETFWDCHALSSAGHHVHIITNANEVEQPFRIQEGFYADQPGSDPRSVSAVRVHHTKSDPVLLRHTPFSNPYISKLAGKATEVIEEYGPFDLIFGYYLEPYGMAAQLTSTWTGVPFGLRHAGSDITRLFRHDGLGRSYQKIARRADFWLAPGLTRRGLHHLGIPYDNIYLPAKHSVPTEYFNPQAKPLDIPVLEERVRRNRRAGGESSAQPTFDPSAPTIGVYGKLGETKGTYDLLEAFSLARRATGRSNLVIVSSGPEPDLRSVRQLARNLEIDDSLTVLPFMPLWLVPSFITACDAVTFLERDFPIAVHRPFVPREILACGGCLILSREVATYQSYADRLTHESNCLLVDPLDHTDLAASLSLVIDDPAAARDIGARGYAQISQGLEDWDSHVSLISENFSHISSEVASRRTAVTMAETQAALGRLYVDEAFRGWFAHAPDEALRTYSLTDSEKDMLKAVDQKMVALFARSLRQKRRERIPQSLPLVAKVYGTELLLHYFDRYYDLHPAQPNHAFAEQLLWFSRYLVECLALEPSAPPHAADIARYEVALTEKRLTSVPGDDLTLIRWSAGDSAEQKTSFVENDRPMLAEGVSVLRFAHDVPAILADIEQDALAAEYPQKATALVVRSVPHASPEILRVNPATASLLDLCTGEYTVAVITARTRESAHASGSKVSQALYGALRNLSERGVIQFSSRAAGPADARQGRGV